MAKRKYARRTTKKQSEGLGDTIEKITTATGIKKAVEWVAGEDCGCEARKQKLNQMFRYSKPNCLTEDEHKQLSTLITRVSVKEDEQRMLNKIYNRVFSANVEFTTCGSCLKDRMHQLRKVYETYEIQD